MSGELLLARIDGQQVGIWRHELRDVLPAPRLHRLPEAPEQLAGVALLDDRLATIFDLSAVLGGPIHDREQPGTFLWVTDTVRPIGFVVPQPCESISITDQPFLPLPAEIVEGCFSGCVRLGAQLIPVLAIGDLLDGCRQARPAGRPRLATQPAATPEPTPSGDLCLANAGGKQFAVPCDQVISVSTSLSATPNIVANLPGAIAPLTGLALEGDEVRCAVDSRALFRRSSIERSETVVWVEERGVRFAVAMDRLGEQQVAAENAHSLPTWLQSGGWQNVLEVDGRLVPVVHWRWLLDAPPAAVAADRDPIGGHSREFASSFCNTEVRVLEIEVAGMLHALPATIAGDPVSLGQIWALPGAPELVCGVTLHDGRLEAVIDLAGAFGKPAGRGDTVLPITDGSFAALLRIDGQLGQRVIPTEMQRRVPVVLPHRYLLGAYPTDRSAAFILDVATLARHFEKRQAATIFRAAAVPEQSTRVADQGATRPATASTSTSAGATPPSEPIRRELYRTKQDPQADHPAQPLHESATQTTATLVQDRLQDRRESGKPVEETLSSLLEPHLRGNDVEQPTAGRGPTGASGNDFPPSVHLSSSAAQRRPDSFAPNQTQVTHDTGAGAGWLIAAAAILLLLGAGWFFWPRQASYPQERAVRVAEEIADEVDPTPLAAPPAKHPSIASAAKTPAKQMPPAPAPSVPKTEITVVISAPDTGRTRTIVHEVQPGETLSIISRRYLGDMSLYPKLARDSSIANADLIEPGWRVVIRIESN